MRWVGPILLLLGGVMLWRALTMQRASSFDDGSFLWEMLLLFGGAILMVLGVGMILLLMLLVR